MSDRRRIRRIELAETRIPSFRSSPGTRTHPQRRSSGPRRTMSPTNSSLIGGRPYPRRFLHRRHLCLAASRCHRSSVSGVTRKDRRRARGSNRLSAASIARSVGRYRTRACSRRSRTCTWCRSTMISMSLSDSVRRDDITRRRRRHKPMYRSEKATLDEGRTSMESASPVTARPSVVAGSGCAGSERRRSCATTNRSVPRSLTTVSYSGRQGHRTGRGSRRSAETS